MFFLHPLWTKLNKDFRVGRTSLCFFVLCGKVDFAVVVVDVVVVVVVVVVEEFSKTESRISASLKLEFEKKADRIF